ncbi:hypothetical protein SynBIOSE41_00231 [Synechococcus sp. BIOS-E4-1]|nr:hypothetical protein SynBIOSE41_00231 [Synechococcus sp. BIOS-E4-1]
MENHLPQSSDHWLACRIHLERALAIGKQHPTPQFDDISGSTFKTLIEPIVSPNHFCQN